MLDAEAEDLPDDLPGVLDDDDLSTNIVNTLNMTTRTVTTQIPPFERFPRFNADAKTWLGKLWQSIFGRNRTLLCSHYITFVDNLWPVLLRWFLCRGRAGRFRFLS